MLLQNNPALYNTSREYRSYLLRYFFLGLDQKKKDEIAFVFLPQIYHKLNLLILWFTKYRKALLIEQLK